MLNLANPKTGVFGFRTYFFEIKQNRIWFIRQMSTPEDNK